MLKSTVYVALNDWRKKIKMWKEEVRKKEMNIYDKRNSFSI